MYSFWVSLAGRLKEIEARLADDDIVLTFETLRAANRPMLPMSFSSNTKLQTALDQVNSYLKLMNNFPINSLLIATEIEAVEVTPDLTHGCSSVLLTTCCRSQSQRSSIT